MPNINQVTAREILDSSGQPTLECIITLDNGAEVRSAAPSGTSKGKYEALELRDNDPARMAGMGVLKAVENVNNLIAPQLIGKDPLNQDEIDQLMINLDGTPNKAKLGSNAMVAVSQAVLKAGAVSQNLPLYRYISWRYQFDQNLSLPTCIYCLVNGGEHGADNLDIQEFEIIPASHIDFPSSLNIAVTLFHKLSEVLTTKGAIHSVGLQGGFAPNLFNNTDAFEILIETIKVSPFTLAQDLFFGVDMAAHELFESGKYHLKDKSQAYSVSEMIEYYKSMRSLYHVFYLEDPFSEDDSAGWKAISSEIGENTLIVGDSLIATNLERLNQAISEKLCNSVLVKPNQIGTISETINLIKAAQAANWQVVISHRSGETCDNLIADLAVGVNANYAKLGPPNRGERTSKYNRLLEIYQQLKAT